jgi:hypothetical protein
VTLSSLSARSQESRLLGENGFLLVGGGALALGILLIDAGIGRRRRAR